MNLQTQTGRILAVLSDGQWHTTAEIHRRAGYSRLNSRIADQRKRGKAIECETVPGQSGAKGYRYRWTNAPEDGGGAPEIMSWEEAPDTGSLYPREPESRYRIYRLRAGAVLDIVSATDSCDGALKALCRHMVEGEFPEGTTPGILDCKGADCDDDGPWDTGSWLVNPWALEREAIIT